MQCPTDAWPHGQLHLAKKSYRCDYVNHSPGSGQCDCVILPGDYYFAPSESHPYRAVGFGNHRYCLGGGHDGCPSAEEVDEAMEKAK